MRSAGEVVALTGANGFVGGAVHSALRNSGYRVRVLSRSGLSRAENPGEVLALPPAEAPAREFCRVLEGAAHLVHAGARNNADRRLGDEAYHGPNVALSAALAQGAAAVLPGRMVFLSSIRAVAGPLRSGVIGDDLPEAPACAYGRSKRAGELACLEAFQNAPDRLGMLRLAPVYGPGMKGNLRALLRLADSPWPLPLQNLPGRRSLLGLDAAVSAVLHLLRCAEVPHPAMLASDLAPVSLEGAVSAFRAGLGRPRRLVPLPVALAEKAARLAGKGQAWDALTVSQVCRPERLVQAGWAPHPESLTGLRAAAAATRG